jgi:hypothetical protein
MYHFTLLHFYENLNLNEELFKLHRLNPEYFNYNNMCFAYQDGTFPYFYWSSGNTNNFQGSLLVSRTELSKYVTAQVSVPIVINCANEFLLPTDYYDCKNNAIIKLVQNGSNALLVSTPEMIAYASQYFPQSYLIGSECLQYHNPSDKDLEKLHFIRCYNPNDLTNDFYSSIPKNKIEICIYSECSHCDNRNECLKTDSVNRLMFAEPSVIYGCTKRQRPTDNFHELITKYVKDGYTHFYFDGHSLPADNTDAIIDLYLKVFVKEEYQNKVYNILKYGE